MNLIWRFLYILLFSRFASKTQVFEEGSITFHVLPTDIDILGHMNNGRYFSLMDVARTDFMIRCDIFPLFAKYKIYPVIASEMIRFKKSLALFQSFQITTRLAGWDEKFFYMIQHFKSQNEFYALGIVKVRFLQKKIGSIGPQKVLELIGKQQPSPKMPEWIQSWQHADQEFHDETMDNDPD